MAALSPFGSVILAVALTAAPALASARAAAHGDDGASTREGGVADAGARAADTGGSARQVDWRRGDIRPVAFDLRGPSQRRGGWRLMADLSDPFDPPAARPRTLPRTSLRFMFDDLHSPQLGLASRAAAREDVRVPGDIRDPFALAGFRGGFFSDNPFDHVDGDLWAPFGARDAASAAESAPTLDCAAPQTDAGLAALWMLVCGGRERDDVHDDPRAAAGSASAIARVAPR